MARQLPQTPVAEFQLSVHEDVFSYGMSWEEPEEVPGYAFSVVAEGRYGERYVHEKSFRMVHSCSQKGCNEGAEEDVCEAHAAQEFKSEGAAKEAAEKLLAKVQAAQAAGTWTGPVDNEHWVEDRPCYGSEAYDVGGWSRHDAAMEKKEDENR